MGYRTADIDTTDIATTDNGPTVIDTTDIGTPDIGINDIGIQLLSATHFSSTIFPMHAVARDPCVIMFYIYDVVSLCFIYYHKHFWAQLLS
jgi:hypothetical protein